VTKLQFLCLEALEDMTLVELNNRYFDGLGIGYTKRVIAGKAVPLGFYSDMYCARFEDKYQQEWIKAEELRISSFGW